MSYFILDLEVTEPFPEVTLGEGEDGVAVLLRRHGRPVAFWMEALHPTEGGPVTLSPPYFEDRIAGHARSKLMSESIREELWPQVGPVPFPSLTVAICTKDRPEWLARCLRSLRELERPGGVPPFETLVVDNAPSDGRTRDAVAAAPGVRYVWEPRPGLDFARNRALAEASGELLAFLDDDVVVDRYWLTGLVEAHAEHPDAAAFTGLVLPYELETPAQILFEERGGFRTAFGAGFEKIRFGARLAGKARYPVEAGIFGVGANMAFRRDVLLHLGGFDEALDTGAPLPGGGDLDVFYRVVRAGHPLVYEPSCLVFHQHRRELSALRRQYWSWGVGFMAFVAKSYATDPAHRPAQRRAVTEWFKYQGGELKGALRRRQGLQVALTLTEIRGGVVGLFGEYARSQRRVERIRTRHA